jgi:hypothetical protein
MNRQSRSWAAIRRTIGTNLFPLIVLSALLSFVVGCSVGRASSAGDKGQSPDQQSVTVEKNGVTVTIAPARGAVNSMVQVDVTGVRVIDEAPFANVSFRDSSGSGGEDSLTTDYTLDMRKTRSDGSLQVLYRIPANVLVKASPDAQNPTRKAPTSLGPAQIVFSWAEGVLEVPFEVVEAEVTEQLPARSPVDVDLGSYCRVESGPDGGPDGMQTWVVRCDDEEHVFAPDEARAVLDKALADGGWSICGAAAGTAYYRKGDRVTTLAFAENDKRNTNFGKVYLGQAPRGVQCP